MRRPRSRLTVSTFPFLAVLLCAMGALILLLLVFDRRAKEAARSRSEARAQAEYDAARAAHEEKIRLHQKTNESIDKAEREKALARHERITRELDAVKAKATAIRQKADRSALLVAEAVAAEEKDLKARQQSRDAIGKLEVRRTELLEKRKQASDLKNQREDARSRQERDLARLEMLLSRISADRERDKQTFSIVPYRGKQGENRRPLYIECSASGLVFHPDRLAVDPITQPRRALDEIDRRADDQNRRQKAMGLPTGARPYLMLLIRPDGIGAYYRFQALARPYDIDFGYEFIDNDWVLDIPVEPGQQVASVPPEKRIQSTSPPDTTVAKSKPVRLSGGNGGSGTGLLTGTGPGEGGPFSGGVPGVPGNSSNGAGNLTGINRSGIGQGRPGMGGGGIRFGNGANGPEGEFGVGAPGGGSGARADTGPGGVPGGVAVGGVPGGVAVGGVPGGVAVGGVPGGVAVGGVPGGSGPGGVPGGVAVGGVPGGNGTGGVPGGVAVGGVPGGSGTGRVPGGVAVGGVPGGSGPGGVPGGGAVGGVPGVSGSGGVPGGVAVGGVPGGSGPGGVDNGINGQGRGTPGGPGGTPGEGGNLGAGGSPSSIVLQMPNQGSSGSGNGGPAGPGAGGSSGGSPGSSGGPGNGSGETSGGSSGSLNGSPGGAGGVPEVASAGTSGAGMVLGNPGGPLAPINGPPPLPDRRPLEPEPMAQTSPGGGSAGSAGGLGSAGGGIEDPDAGDLAPLGRALVPLPLAARDKPSAPRPLRPAKLAGASELVLFIECRADGAILHPGGKKFTLADLSGSSNALVEELRRQIDRRQALSRPGGTLPKPHLRYLVWNDGLRSYHSIYPTLRDWDMPKSQQSIESKEELREAMRP